MYFSAAIRDEEYSAPNLSEGTPEQVRRRRQWELWSVQDKNLFFVGLFEASYFQLHDFNVIVSFC